jgi:hypothetical protein
MNWVEEIKALEHFRRLRAAASSEEDRVWYNFLVKRYEKRLNLFAFVGDPVYNGLATTTTPTTRRE